MINNRLKIGDFGISAILKSTKYASSKVGTYNYMAPEIIKGQKYNNKVDIWALGCIIYELCTLNICFDSSSILDLCNKIINVTYDKFFNNKELSFLLDLLLKKDYKERPDIEQIYKLVIQFIKKNTINEKKNEIKLRIEINKFNINNNISILGYLKPGLDRQILRELNESNTEIYINDKKYKFCRFFKFPKEGIYHIKLKFNVNIRDCSYMFFECHELISIDLSSFFTNNVTNMEAMFFYCYNLKNINLSSFNTQNVTNMNSMFLGCSNLTNLDLSSFNTQNVVDMSNMFEACKSLSNLDLSSFNTNKVVKMAKMFDSCTSLKNINLNSFKNENLINMDFMFQGCKNLKIIDLSSFDKIFGFYVFNGVKAKIIINKNAFLDKNCFELSEINITFV